MTVPLSIRRPEMWKVRKSKQIGAVTFWEVYKVLPSGDTVFRGKWRYESEAQALADKLNKEAHDADTV